MSVMSLLFSTYHPAHLSIHHYCHWLWVPEVKPAVACLALPLMFLWLAFKSHFLTKKWQQSYTEVAFSLTHHFMSVIWNVLCLSVGLLSFAADCHYLSSVITFCEFSHFGEETVYMVVLSVGWGTLGASTQWEFGSEFDLKWKWTYDLILWESRGWEAGAWGS